MGPTTRPEVVACVRTLFAGTELNCVKKHPDRLPSAAMWSAMYGQQGFKSVAMACRKGYIIPLTEVPGSVANGRAVMTAQSLGHAAATRVLLRDSLGTVVDAFDKMSSAVNAARAT